MTTPHPRRALIVVDVQNDFCEGGSLAVGGGNAVAEGIADYIAMADYDVVVATKDWHVDPGDHWSEEPNYRTTWPVHCRADEIGAQFNPALNDVTDRFAAVFYKGRFEAAYSGFEGQSHPDGTGERLETFLKERQIENVDVVGIATDHCVRLTVLDALKAGLQVRVLLAMTAGVAEETAQAALVEMRQAGAELLGEPVLES